MTNLIKTIFSVCFFISAFTLNAQTIERSILHDFSSPENTNPDSTNNEIMFVSAESGQIIVAGHILEADSSQKIFTGAFDYAGNVLWKKTISIPSGFVTMELATNENLKKTADGHFAIAGLMSGSLLSDTARIPFLYVFDGSTGDSLNFLQYNEPVWKLGSLIIDDSGAFVMGGVMNINGSNSNLDYARRIWLIKINSAGSMVWIKKSYSSPPLSRFFNVQNIIDNGNEYVLLMTLVTGDPYLFAPFEDNNQTDVSVDFQNVIFIHSTPEWFTSYVNVSPHGAYIPDIILIRKKNQTGYYFLSAASDMSFGSPPRCWYFGDMDNQFDAPYSWYNGFSMTGRPEYSLTNSTGNVYLELNNRGGLRIKEAINGDLILLQNATITDFNTVGTFTPFIMRTNAQGEQKWRNYFLHVPDIFLKLNQKLNDQSIAPDGRIVLAGSVESYTLYPELSITKKGRTSWLLILNDSIHDTPNSIDELAQELRNQINLYPNPATDKINLTYKDLHILELSLVDLMGRKVKSFPATSTVLNVSELNPGFYSLQIVTDKGRTAKKLVVQ